MRHVLFLSLLTVVIALPYSEAAPAPKRTEAKPAVIDVGNEKNIAWVSDGVVSGAWGAVRQNKDVAALPIVRQQKDRDSWLKKKLRFEKVEGSTRVRISLRDGKLEEQAAIINAAVDDFLKREVARRRASVERSLRSHKGRADRLRRSGKADEAAEWENRAKRDEKELRTLPALVEQAKAR